MSSPVQQHRALHTRSLRPSTATQQDTHASKLTIGRPPVLALAPGSTGTIDAPRLPSQASSPRTRRTRAPHPSPHAAAELATPCPPARRARGGATYTPPRTRPPRRVPIRTQSRNNLDGTGEGTPKGAPFTFTLQRVLQRVLAGHGARPALAPHPSSSAVCLTRPH